MWCIQHTVGLILFREEIPLYFESLDDKIEAMKVAQKWLQEKRKEGHCKIRNPFLIWKEALE